MTIIPPYRDAIKVALILQVLTTMLLLTILDGGSLAKIGGCAIAGFWIGAAMVMLRRPNNPDRLDLLYLRWGYAVVLAAGMALSPLMGILR